MRSSRGFLAALLLVVPVLAGCGDDSDEGDDDTPPSSSSPSSPGDDTEGSSPGTTDTTAGTSTAPAGLPSACDVLTPDDVAAAFGVDFGPAEPGAGGYTQQDIEWQSDNCDWEAEDLVEVQLALTGPDDFTVGEFQCLEPGDIASTVTPVDVPGADQAWWDEDDAPPLEATLRVCTASYNFEIELEYEDGVDFQGDPQQQSIALAEVVIGKLG